MSESYQSAADRQLLEEHAEHPERFAKVEIAIKKKIRRKRVSDLKRESAQKSVRVKQLSNRIRKMTDEIKVLITLKVRKCDNQKEVLSKAKKIAIKYKTPTKPITPHNA